jgi:hypothetical protein
VRLEEGGDAAVRHRVPDLDAPVHRPGHEMLPVIGPSAKEKITFTDYTIIILLALIAQEVIFDDRAKRKMQYVTYLLSVRP